VTVDPSEHFVYVANWGSHDVSAFTIDKKTGGLTKVQGSPYGADLFPYAVIVDADSQFAFIANNGAGNISSYTFDNNTGALATVKGSPFNTNFGPYSLAIGFRHGNNYRYHISRSSGGITVVPPIMTIIDGFPAALVIAGIFEIVRFER